MAGRARDPGWGERRARALRLLTDADRIESIAQLVGADSLPGHERITLRTARLLREAVLQQSAVLENDQFSSPGKQRALLTLVLDIHERLIDLLAGGIPVAELEAVDLRVCSVPAMTPRRTAPRRSSGSAENSCTRSTGSGRPRDDRSSKAIRHRSSTGRSARSAGR